MTFLEVGPDFRDAPQSIQTWLNCLWNLFLKWKVTVRYHAEVRGGWCDIYRRGAKMVFDFPKEGPTKIIISALFSFSGRKFRDIRHFCLTDNRITDENCLPRTVIYIPSISCCVEPATFPPRITAQSLQRLPATRIHSVSRNGRLACSKRTSAKVTWWNPLFLHMIKSHHELNVN